MIIVPMCECFAALTNEEKITIKEARKILLNLFDEMATRGCDTIECEYKYTYNKTDLAKYADFLSDFEKLNKIKA